MTAHICTRYSNALRIMNQRDIKSSQRASGHAIEINCEERKQFSFIAVLYDLTHLAIWSYN